MASITSLMGGSSGTGGLYGNRNVISGLASGMDTEAMIENAISGYQKKIGNLQQDYTLLEWKQSAYRSMISKMNNFTNKYLSYTSNTNLMSQTFFNGAVNMKTLGEHASKITATGRPTSTVEVKGVKQMAKAASYAVDKIGSRPDQTTIKGEKVELSDKHEVSNVSGTLKIKYGNDKTFTVKLEADELVANGQELADKINEKLGEQEMALNDGRAVKVSERIRAEYDAASDSIKLVDAVGAGNQVWLSGASGKIKETLDITTKSTQYDVNATSFSAKPKDSGKTLIDDSQTNAEYLATQAITFKLDGASHKITLGDAVKNATTMEEVKNALQSELDSRFGTDKITVEVDATTGGLNFKPADGSSLTISNGTAMGMASATETSYISTGRTLGSLMDDSDFANLEQNNRIQVDDESKLTKEEVKDGVTYKLDDKGNRYKEDGGKWYQVDSKGDYLYDFQINGKSVGKFSKNSTLKQVMDAVDKSAAGVTVTYSQTSNYFMFTAKNTGEASKVEMGEGLAQVMFGDSKTLAEGGTPTTGPTGEYTKGQDAVVTLSVNGKELTDKKYTTNSFDVDGMNIKLNGTFNYENGVLKADAEAITFETETDTEAIVTAVRDMVKDYNEMATEIKKAYSEMPQYNSKGDRYKPLTEEDQADMSDAAIEKYEEKAKQGLLFGDRDLSGLYNGLTNAINSMGSQLKAIGIEVNFNEGTTTMTLDEAKLKSVLEQDPDRVRNALAGDNVKEGVLQKMNTTLERYGKVTGATKGILVQKAGTPLAATSLLSNELLKEMDQLNEQIDKWQEKMADQVDYYTSKFTALEQLILEMNSQSSALMGLMGG